MIVSVYWEQPSPVFYWPGEHVEQAVQVPLITAVQVFTVQYWPELQEVHAAHVVSTYKEQPPVFYSPEEQVEQVVSDYHNLVQN